VTAGGHAPSRGSAGSALRCASCRGYLIYDPIAPDPDGIINQGQGNLTARSIQVRQGETINERALLNLFKVVIANNRAGGWRKIKANR
jgi:hypothetical protein